MRISDWSSDVCSSDLLMLRCCRRPTHRLAVPADQQAAAFPADKDTADGVERGARDIGDILAPQRKFDPHSDVGWTDRKSVVEGKRGSGRVGIGGRRIITQKTNYDGWKHDGKHQ